jgi:hypothetical protein
MASLLWSPLPLLWLASPLLWLAWSLLGLTWPLLGLPALVLLWSAPTVTCSLSGLSVTVTALLGDGRVTRRTVLLVLADFRSAVRTILHINPTKISYIKFSGHDIRA